MSPEAQVKPFSSALVRTKKRSVGGGQYGQSHLDKFLDPSGLDATLTSQETPKPQPKANSAASKLLPMSKFDPLPLFLKDPPLINSNTSPFFRPVLPGGVTGHQVGVGGLIAGRSGSQKNGGVGTLQ